MHIRILYIFALALAASLPGFAAGLSFSLADSHAPIEVKPEASTGLNQIYVLFSTSGAKATYSASSPASVRWLKYSNLGGGYAQEIATERNGSEVSAMLDNSDMGYIIEDGDSRFYFWVTNYAAHYPSLSGIAFDPEQDCDRTRLQLQGSADMITYYTINGQARRLDRELSVQYRTLTFDEAAEQYVQTDANESLPYINGTFTVPAPLCDTEFTLTADRFLREWNLEEKTTSDMFTSTAVEAHVSATQDERNNDNEQDVETEGLGGSAPVEITFKAAVSDAAIYHEWEMSRDANFEVIDDRYRDLEFSYSFRENGTSYVRFVADNADASCPYTSETFEVFVGESELRCPNAFSPGASEGVNDEWKVSYKSLVSFECHIFNRWGQKMATLTDPSQGWDGKYKGKLVPAGAYYYVIKATGSDGKKYNKSGDINIVRSRNKGISGDQGGATTD